MSSQAGRKKRVGLGGRAGRVGEKEAGAGAGSLLSTASLLLLATLAGCLNYSHVSTLFENDRHFRFPTATEKFPCQQQGSGSMFLEEQFSSLQSAKLNNLC